jgi:hypothetical protein
MCFDHVPSMTTETNLSLLAMRRGGLLEALYTRTRHFKSESNRIFLATEEDSDAQRPASGQSR